ALALVRLWTAIGADFSGDLANDLLVDARNDDFRRLRHGNGDALRSDVVHVVAEAQRKRERIALHRRTITNAIDLELALETGLHAVQDVGDLCAGHAPLRTRILGLVARLDLNRTVFQLHQHFFVKDELKLALRALSRDGLTIDGSGNALRHRNRLLANT